MKNTSDEESGFTIVELIITLVILGIIASGILGLLWTLINSELATKRRAVASTLATNQMEYIKSLPYNSLAVAGGSIISSSPLPNTTTQTIDNVTYTVKTSINYVDDAFDGCASYPTQELKELYCRNYPPPTGAPSTDQNPSDYKVVHVSVYAPATTKLAEVDTNISARVSETANNTGALFVKILDANGNPVSGATVNVRNTTLTPTVDVSDSSDSNGVAIFYGLPPDNGNDYVITGSLTDYSSLWTIKASGSLQPNYPSQKIITQQSSFVTLTLNPMSSYSLVGEVTDTSGSPLSGAKIYTKGGYKKYTDATNTAYYYDNVSPTDTRPTSDASGLFSLQDLAPGNYIFCGDSGATSCNIGGTTYYLAAAVPYSGSNTLNPITVPTYVASSPPATTFSYGGHEYVQKVRLMLTTNSSFPRLFTMTPQAASIAAGDLSGYGFQITGMNLPCSASAASCATTVKFLQGASTWTASCTGSAAGTNLDCTIDLTGASQGKTQLQVSANGYTLTLPAGSLIGGVLVSP